MSCTTFLEFYKESKSFFWLICFAFSAMNKYIYAYIGNTTLKGCACVLNGIFIKLH